MNHNSFLGLIEHSIRLNWDLPAMTDYQGSTLYYRDFAKEIDKIHEYLKAAGVGKGDKVSICGKNSSNWAITFFSEIGRASCRERV